MRIVATIGWYLALIVLLSKTTQAQNSDTLILTDSFTEELLNAGELFYYIDTTTNLPADSVTSQSFQKKFSRTSFKTLATSVPQQVYWLKFSVKNEAPSKHWILESFNYRIDSVVLYERKDNKLVVHYSGSSVDFENRFLNHKNINFSLDIRQGETKTYYIKVRTTQSTSIEFVVRSLDFFASYAFNEYIFLGIFYGALLLIIISNLFLLFFLKRVSILFYVLYIFSSLIFFSCQDGIGFQYLWPNNPSFNYHAYSLSLICMTVFLLLYTSSFSKFLKRHSWIKTIIYAYIIYRVALQVFITIYYPEIKHFVYTDILPFFFAFLLAVLSFRKGNRPALYFTISQSIMITVVIIYSLRMFGIIGSGVLVFYSFNFAVVMEMLFFTFAFAQRIRDMSVKKRLNKQLKSLLNAKLKEYDEFLYRSSHDIKGPVKTIMGLANLALIDNTGQKDDYFKMIGKIASNLDDVTNDISHISSINNAEIKPQKIDFKSLVDKLHSYHLEKRNISFTLTENGEVYLQTDPFLLLVILENITDNIVKYRNEYEKNAEIEIKISSRGKKTYIRVIDKTNCIPLKSREKAFNIFFRLDNSNYGVGLYISKVASEKINGVLCIDENNNDETVFILIVGNLKKS